MPTRQQLYELDYERPEATLRYIEEPAGWGRTLGEQWRRITDA